MKHLFLISLLLTFSVITNAQVYKLNKAISLDTLHLSVEFSDKFEPDLSNQLVNQIKKGVDRFNKKEIGFYATLDTNKSDDYIIMQFDSIKYVERKHNIIWTGVGLLTIAANAYLISTASIILPFVLTPAAIAKGNLKTSKDLLTNKYRKFWINPSGYLRKKEKQKEKIVNYTEKKTYHFLKNLGKQDWRNN
mgnify:CR=1 FL=1